MYCTDPKSRAATLVGYIVNVKKIYMYIMIRMNVDMYTNMGYIQEK